MGDKSFGQLTIGRHGWDSWVTNRGVYPGVEVSGPPEIMEEVRVCCDSLEGSR